MHNLLLVQVAVWSLSIDGTNRSTEVASRRSNLVLFSIQEYVSYVNRDRHVILNRYNKENTLTLELMQN